MKALVGLLNFAHLHIGSKCRRRSRRKERLESRRTWGRPLPSLQALYTSDTAAPCYCGCEEQLEPEQIELLAAMTDVVMQPCARGNLRKAHRDAVFAEQ